MPRMKSPEKEVKKLLNELVKYRSEKRTEGQDLYHQLKEKYPYDVYGCDGELKIADKMKKYSRHMQEVDCTITALENVIWSIEEEMKKYDEKR